MKINEIIRQRRTALGLTQEQVANALGVTAPAVHKWEKGASYPDITLLPALARLLDTDLNTLLSFQADLSEREIALFLNELAEQLDAEGFDAADQTAMDKIRDYPTCYTLILNTALFLDGACSMKGMVSEQYETKLETLYTRALDSTDPTIRNKAKCILISKRMQEQDYTAAQELLQTLPDPDSTDKQQLQANLYLAQGLLEQAAKIEEGKLLSLTNELHQTLITLMEIARKDGRMEDAEYIANVSKQGAILFDLWEYSAYVAQFQLYSASKNKLKCLRVLLPMLKSLTHPWDINASPLYRHIKTKPVDTAFGPKMQKTFSPLSAPIRMPLFCKTVRNCRLWNMNLAQNIDDTPAGSACGGVFFAFNPIFSAFSMYHLHKPDKKITLPRPHKEASFIFHF